MKRQLPVLVERAFAEVKALQAQASAGFEGGLRHKGAQVSCRKGCSNCCHHPFLITVAEGVLLYRWLAAHGRWSPSTRTRIEEARDKTLGLSFHVWLMSNLACPILEDGKCLAYDARPTHCRTTYSMGDPAMCHPHGLGMGEGFIQNLEAIQDFTQDVQAVLKRVGAAGPLMPLAEAVLLGEAIDSGRLDIEDATVQHARDLHRE